MIAWAVGALSYGLIAAWWIGTMKAYRVPLAERWVAGSLWPATAAYFLWRLMGGPRLLSGRNGGQA